MTEHNLLSENQLGFRKGHSTGTCVASMLKPIYDGMDDTSASGVIFLDLKKAFDTVDHRLLLNKLVRIGLGRDSVGWFKSYLKDRTQRVKYSNVLSNIGRVTCGVPQGSILGPLLFILFVNDFPLCLQSASASLYADDTAIVLTRKSDIELQACLETEMGRAATWMRQNRLTLNTKKKKLMIFGTPQTLTRFKHIKLDVDGQVIERVTTFKYLGLTLDTNLKFKEHVEVTYTKTVKQLCMLNNFRNKVGYQLARYIYITTILPHFDYLDFIYDCLSIEMSDKLEWVQSRGMRILLSEGPLASTEEMRQRAQIPRKKIRREDHTNLFTFRAVNDLAPAAIKDMSISLEDTRERETRASTRGDLYEAPHATDSSNRCISKRGPRLYNVLTPEKRSVGTLSAFKESLKVAHGFDNG